MDKVWSVSTVEYYSAIKRNEALMHATTWMNLKQIMLSARSQSQEATYCMTLLYEMSIIGKSIQAESR